MKPHEGSRPPVALNPLMDCFRCSFPEVQTKVIPKFGFAGDLGGVLEMVVRGAQRSDIGESGVSMTLGDFFGYNQYIKST